MRSLSLLVYKAVDGAIEVGAACCPHPFLLSMLV